MLSSVKELEHHLPSPVEPGSTLAKIQSRLLSSKILSAQVAASVESLRILVNPALKPQKGKDTRVHEGMVEELKGHNDPSSHPIPSEEDEDSSPLVADDLGWESGTVDMEDGIVDDASWESDNRSGPSSSGPEHLSKFDEKSATESDNDSDGAAFRNSGSSKKVKANSITDSTFLPSLSVGFIHGSDDSDFDEAAESKAADIPRKNRRGQRARRACVCSITFSTNSSS
jgi:hypothetical protein